MGHQNLHFRMGITQILALGLLFLGQGCQSLSHKRGADPDVAIQHFEENMGPAKKCADDLVAMKQDKEGRVTIEWTVNDKGETLHPKVTENSWKDPEVEECFLSLLKSLKFPPTPLFSKSTVAYTFKWSSLVDKDQSKSPRLSP